MNNYRIKYLDVLVHHGILGQKWGKRNGPPYPLKESDKSAAEKKHYNVSAKEVHKNMDQMPDKELQQAINRINMQNQIKSLDKGIIRRGMDAILGRANYFNTSYDTVKKTYGVATTLAKL